MRWQYQKHSNFLKELPMPRNQQIVLDNRPQGETVASNFKLVATDTPPLQDGQVLVRHHYLSLDPTCAGRRTRARATPPRRRWAEVMIGGTVGGVAESKHPKVRGRQRLVGMGGWQDYGVVNADQPGALRKVDTTHVPLSHYLGAVGMPGVTAWYGLVKISRPRKATLWWWRTTGAVGNAFAALARPGAAARGGHCGRCGWAFWYAGEELV